MVVRLAQIHSRTLERHRRQSSHDPLLKVFLAGYEVIVLANFVLALAPALFDAAAGELRVALGRLLHPNAEHRHQLVHGRGLILEVFSFGHGRQKARRIVHHAARPLGAM